MKEQDKSRMSEEIIFNGRMAKYTRQEYKTNEDILSELKINPVVKKIQNYRNKWMDVWRTDKVPHLIIKYKPLRKYRQEQLLERLVRLLTGPIPCKL